MVVCVGSGSGGEGGGGGGGCCGNEGNDNGVVGKGDVDGSVRGSVMVVTEVVVVAIVMVVAAQRNRGNGSTNERWKMLSVIFGLFFINFKRGFMLTKILCCANH